MPKSGYSQNGEVYLSHIEGDVNNEIPYDSTVTFYFSFFNSTGEILTGSTNGFRIYSSGGMSWDTTVAEILPSLAFWVNHYNSIFINRLGLTGSGSDTIGLGGFAIFEPGIPTEFDTTVLKITVGPFDISYVGEYISIDSCYYPPVSTWLWSTDDNSYKPDWDGPHEFQIIDPVPDTIEITGQLKVDNAAEGTLENLSYFEFEPIIFDGTDTVTLGDTIVTDFEGKFKAKIEENTEDIMFRISTRNNSSQQFQIRSASAPNGPFIGIFETGLSATIDRNINLNLDSLVNLNNTYLYEAVWIMRQAYITDSILDFHLTGFSFEKDPTKLLLLYDSAGTVFNETLWELIGTTSRISLEQDKWQFQTICHEFGHELFYQLNNKDTSIWTSTNYASHYPSFVSDSIFAFKEGFADFIRVISGVPENFKDLNYPDPTMNYEVNDWWRGELQNNTDGNIVEGSVGSMLLDLYDDETTPKNRSGDDENVRNPSFFLNVIFNCIEVNNLKPPSQQTLTMRIFGQTLQDTNQWWHSYSEYTDVQGTICRDIFGANMFAPVRPIDESDRPMKLTSVIDDCPNDAIDDVEESEVLEPIIPLIFDVSQNYPNPFNGETRIMFTAPEKGNYSIEIINILGQMISEISFQNLQKGEHWVEIDDNILGRMASGVYFYKVSSKTKSITKKMVYLK